MKFIRLIIVSVLLLFAVASFIGILLPSHVLVSRAVNIAVPKDSVQLHVNNIYAWSAWMDGMDHTDVHISSPTQADFAGTHVSLRSVTDTSVVSLWITKDGHEQTSTMRLIYDTTQHLTIAQWQFEQQLKWYPWERLGSMMNDKILGTMMEKDLQNLKTITEKQGH